jgi:hypothetical protein
VNTATRYICLINQIIQNKNNLNTLNYNLGIMYRKILAGNLAFLLLSAYVYDPTYIGPQYKKSAYVYDPTYIGPYQLGREQHRALKYRLGKKKNNINI